MTALRIRPNNDFIHTANWKEIYMLTKHWQSDVEFFAYEIKFLLNLTNKYFIWLTDDQNIETVASVQKDLKRLRKEQKELADNLKTHLNHITALLENAFIYDEHTFKDEHIALENKLTDFTKTFKEVKKQVFKCTEEVLNSENHSI